LGRYEKENRKLEESDFDMVGREDVRIRCKNGCGGRGEILTHKSSLDFSYVPQMHFPAL
jgi:hypothetical protein